MGAVCSKSMRFDPLTKLLPCLRNCVCALQPLALTGLSGGPPALQIDEGMTNNEPAFSTVAMVIPESSPLSEVPCGQCPVIHQCAEGNDISPATCEYMQAWLAF